MSERQQISGHFLQASNQALYPKLAHAKNRIYIYPELDAVEGRDKIIYGDVHEAVCRYLVDKLGFSTKSFTVTDGSRFVLDGDLVAAVDFVDDGIILAKIHGLLE